MAACLNFAVRYIKGDVVRLGRRLLPTARDTGDWHSSQRGSGEALRRAEAAVLGALQNVLGAEVLYNQETRLFDGGLTSTQSAFSN